MNIIVIYALKHKWFGTNKIFWCFFNYNKIEKRWFKNKLILYWDESTNKVKKNQIG